jgi:hypothetical protein
MVKKLWIGLVIIVVVVAIGIGYYYSNTGSKSYHSSTTILYSSSIAPNNTFQILQNNLLNGGGSKKSYASKNDLDQIFGSGSYSIVLCNQTYYTNYTLCNSYLRSYRLLYGKNVTLWFIKYNTSQIKFGETVLLANKTINNIYPPIVYPMIHINSTNLTILNSTNNATFNNSTYYTLVRKIPNIGIENYLYVYKGQRVAAIRIIESNYSLSQNKALLNTIYNDLP